MKNFYISTSIAYVNGAPHVGFALESILADSLARSRRLFGEDVFFLTGADEHGIKIYKTAKENKLTPEQLCEQNSNKFKNLKENLNLSRNDFIRTSDKEKHRPSVLWLWEKLEKNGDLYKKHYEGKYCEGCETFFPEKDLVDGKCPIHKKETTLVSEENYFFRLSKYSEKILEKIQKEELKIVPDFRKNEILKMLEGDGLKDVSFSRPSENLPWGVPVPGDASQRMYVWCDALTNYISALLAPDGVNYKKFWEEAYKVHVIGKDIVRFHAGIWIGMLLSAELPLPNVIHIHGFLTSEGEKMSKSLGNVVDPVEYTEKYGEDPLRYYLLREVPTGRDADFSKEHFLNIYNAHLANGLGNLVNRVVVMSKKNGIKPSAELENLFEDFTEKIFSNVKKELENLDTNKAILSAWELVDFGNKQMDELKPWVLKKENEEEFKKVMENFLELIRSAGFLLSPFLPETSEKIFKILGLELPKNFEEFKKQKENWSELGEAEILFAKLEE